MTPDIYSKAIIDKVCQYVESNDKDELSEYISFSKNLMGNSTYRVLERTALSANSSKEFKVLLGAELASEINTETINTHHLSKESMGYKISKLGDGDVPYKHRDRLKLGLELISNTGLKAPVKAIKTLNHELNNRMFANPSSDAFDIALNMAIEARGLISSGVKNELCLINKEYLKNESSSEIGLSINNMITKTVSKFRS